MEELFSLSITALCFANSASRADEANEASPSVCVSDVSIWPSLDTEPLVSEVAAQRYEKIVPQWNCYS